MFAGREVNLGREDHARTIDRRERFADDDLGLAVRIGVGGVDEVDACVERAVDDADRVIMVRVAPAAKHHGAETQGAYFYSGTSKVIEFHAATLRCARRRRFKRLVTSRTIHLEVFALSNSPHDESRAKWCFSVTPRYRSHRCAELIISARRAMTPSINLKSRSARSVTPLPVGLRSCSTRSKRDDERA